MTFLAAETEELTLGELHDLSPEAFSSIYVEVHRRIEPGAGAFGGVQFLTTGEDVTQFATVEDALAFIDDLQTGGIPAAIRGQLGDDLTDEDIVQELRFYNDVTDPSDYLDHAGLHDPFNLTIIPKREITREIEVVNPQPAEPTAPENLQA